MAPSPGGGTRMASAADSASVCWAVVSWCQPLLLGQVWNGQNQCLLCRLGTAVGTEPRSCAGRSWTPVIVLCVVKSPVTTARGYHELARPMSAVELSTIH